MLRYRELVQATLAGETTRNCPVLMWKHHPVLDQEAETLAGATVAPTDAAAVSSMLRSSAIPVPRFHCPCSRSRSHPSRRDRRSHCIA